MRLSFAEALTEAAEAAWAYTDIWGTLRCPDCNSDADMEGVPFHEDERKGAVIVTDDDECIDCGVVLSEDEACAPWTLRTPVESCWWGS